MIISASRRTDIPAFYAKWFMNRLRAGYCHVPNPFNIRQVTRVELGVEEVDAIVFWSRNPRPMFTFLEELDDRNYRYVFNVTILNNPRQLDARSPDLRTSLETFRKLSDRVGGDRMTWRYDPIVFSNLTDDGFHRRNFEYLAQSLRGYTRRCIISIVHVYRKCLKRLRELADEGLILSEPNGSQINELMTFIADAARNCGMDIFSCAQATDFSESGIRAGKCIDGYYLSELFGIQLDNEKDPSQRQHCGCILSKDIGMYDSCLYDCQYCYATSSQQRARENYKRHHPDSPSLIGWYS